MITKSTKATLAILIAVCFWGMTFAFIKVGVENTSVFNFLFWRFGIASLLLYLLFYKKIILTNKKLITQGLTLGLLISSTVILQTIGLQYTPASTASFITGTAVIWVAIISHLMNKQWPKLNIIVAIILAMIGIALITLTATLVINMGDLWILLCAFCFAFHIISTGYFSHSDSPLTLTFIQMLTVCVISGVINITTHHFAVPVISKLWISIIFCAVFASVISFSLQTKFQKYVSATKTAIIFSSEPIFATITAMIYLDEKLTAQFIIGAICVFSAMLLAEFKSKKKILPQEPI